MLQLIAKSKAEGLPPHIARPKDPKAAPFAYLLAVIAFSKGLSNVLKAPLPVVVAWFSSPMVSDFEVLYGFIDRLGWFAWVAARMRFGEEKEVPGTPSRV